MRIKVKVKEPKTAKWAETRIRSGFVIAKKINAEWRLFEWTSWLQINTCPIDGFERWVDFRWGDQQE